MLVYNNTSRWVLWHSDEDVKQWRMVKRCRSRAGSTGRGKGPLNSHKLTILTVNGRIWVNKEWLTVHGRWTYDSLLNGARLRDISGLPTSIPVLLSPPLGVKSLSAPGLLRDNCASSKWQISDPLAGKMEPRHCQESEIQLDWVTRPNITGCRVCSQHWCLGFTGCRSCSWWTCWYRRRTCLRWLPTGLVSLHGDSP